VWMDDDAFNRTDDLALRLVVMSDAFGAAAGLDLVDFGAHADGVVRALGLANVAVDVLVGNEQSHDINLPLSRYCTTLCPESQLIPFGWPAHLLHFGLQPAFHRGKHELADVAAHDGDFTHDGARDE